MMTGKEVGNPRATCVATGKKGMKGVLYVFGSFGVLFEMVVLIDEQHANRDQIFPGKFLSLRPMRFLLSFAPYQTAG